MVAALAARSGAEVIGGHAPTVRIMARREALGLVLRRQDITDAKTVCDRSGIAITCSITKAGSGRGGNRQVRRRICRWADPGAMLLVQPGCEIRRPGRFAKDLAPTASPPATMSGGSWWMEPSYGRAATAARDQSYSSTAPPRTQLDYLALPLGGLPKSEGAAPGRRRGAGGRGQARQPDICFVPTAIMPAWSRNCPRPPRPARSRRDGKVLGAHQGVVFHHRPAQRESRSAGRKSRLRCPDRARDRSGLVFGPRRALAVSSASVAGINWLAEDQARGAGQWFVSMAPAVPAQWDESG